MAQAAANIRELNADNPGSNEGEGKQVAPLTPEQQQKRLDGIKETWQSIARWKQDRKQANEELSALREKLITAGISREVQKVFAQVEKLDADDLQTFAVGFSLICQANGKPLQRELQFDIEAAEDGGE